MRMLDEGLIFDDKYLNILGDTYAMTRGQGTGGGGATSPRIRDLYSKNFENSQNIFFFLVSDHP